MPAILGVIGRLIGAGALRAAGTALAKDQLEDLQDQTVSVSSSCINTIGYHDGVIVVEFKRGGTYSYEGSPELFAAFVAAPSKGEFFNSHFR